MAPRARHFYIVDVGGDAFDQPTLRDARREARRLVKGGGFQRVVVTRNSFDVDREDVPVYAVWAQGGAVMETMYSPSRGLAKPRMRRQNPSGDEPMTRTELVEQLEEDVFMWEESWMDGGGNWGMRWLFPIAEDAGVERQFQVLWDAGEDPESVVGVDRRAVVRELRDQVRNASTPQLRHYYAARTEAYEE